MDNKNSKKAAKLIERGNKFLAKGKLKQALKEFEMAMELDPERADIYDKLISTHKNMDIEWDEYDIAKSLSWEMKKQEIDNPNLKYTHAQLQPQWKKITNKIQLLINECDDKKEAALIEEIHDYSTDAIYPLIHTLLQIKHEIFNLSQEKNKCKKEKEK